jgi:hypothetical protein
VAGYLALLALLLLLLAEARRQTIAALDSALARRQWQAWKAEVQREAQRGPAVRRRVPTSEEPPALILLRDHFGAVAFSSAVICTCLYLFLAIVIRGAWFGGSAPRDR